MHRCHPSFGRFGDRSTALRMADASDNCLNILGLSPTGSEKAINSPLIALFKALSKANVSVDTPLTEHGMPVVHSTFDPYRSVFVSPDHLLSGLAINVLTVAFRQLPDRRWRAAFDRLICGNLRSNCLIQQQRVYNLKTSLPHTTSISGTFCILHVATAIFE